MDINAFFDPNEKPLDRIVDDGGFCSIFRRIGFIGDSLSSGEFEGRCPDGNTYHDMYEYSHGQFFARAAGIEALNFSRGGMTGRTYCNSFADESGFWDPALACRAYVVAMGVNEITEAINESSDLGSMDDVHDDWHENTPNFAGYYAQMLARYHEISPDAFFFLVTIPREETIDRRSELADQHREILYRMAERFPNTYVLDLRQYGPVYDAAFREKFYLHGHMNPMGYYLTAKLIMSYIDYIVRHDMPRFARIGFATTPFVGFAK